MRQKAVKLVDSAGIGLVALLVGALGLIGIIQDGVSRQVTQLQADSPIILSRHASLQTAHGEQVIPIAWTETALGELAQAVSGLGVVSPIAAGQAFFRAEGGDYLDVTVLTVGPDLLARLAPNARCLPSQVHLSGDFPQSVARGVLSGQAVLVAPLGSSFALQALAPDTAKVVLVRCAATASSYPRVALLPARGQNASALATATAYANGARDDSSFAPVTVNVERLSDAATRELGRTYGWLPSLKLAFVLTLVGVVSGLAFFDATRARTDFDIRRALGSSMGALLAQSTRRVARQLGIASAIGFGTLFSIAALSTRIAISSPAIGTLLLSAGIAGCAAVAAHVSLTLPGIDRRIVVRSSAAGSAARTIGAGACLAVMALILVGFAATSLLLGRHAKGLERLGLGYEAHGLYAIRAIPLTPRAQTGEATFDLLAVPVAGIEAASAAVTCTAPWALDSFLLQGLYRNAAVTLASGGSIARVLGLRITGRDLSSVDVASSRPMLVQALDTQFAHDSRVFGHEIGRVRGLQFGALSPSPRNAIIKSLRGHPCLAPLVLFRPSNSTRPDDQARSLTEQLGARIESYAFMAPVRVEDELADARAPLRRLRALAAGGLAVAALSVVLLSALLSLVFVRSRLRQIAIRHALGEPPVHTAIGIAKLASVFAAGGALLGALGALGSHGMLARQVPGIGAYSVADLAIVVVVVTAVMTLAAAFFSHRYISRSDLVTAWRVE